MNENKNTTYQNLWSTIKAVIREKFTVVNAYVKKKFQVNNLTFHLKEMVKEKCLECQKGKNNINIKPVTLQSKNYLRLVMVNSRKCCYDAP